MSMFSKIQTKLAHLAAIGLVVVALVAPAVAAAATQPRDADTNSIIYNGAYTKTELLSKIQNGDGKHTAANIQQIMYSEGRGITQANLTSSSTVDGTVFKDGRVEVGGRTVAVNARSVGRNFVAGSTQSGSVWERPTSSVFLSDSIPAFVHMEGGVFRYAVIKSCGNPVRATATTKPTPTPTATPRPTSTPTPSVTPTPTPTPTPAPSESFKCVRLTATQPDKVAQPGTFRFSVTPEINNVTLTGYRFTVGQEGSDTPPDIKDIDATNNFADYTLGAGTWFVAAQVKTSAGITELSKTCSAIVTVAEAPTPSPTPTPVGQVLSATLPVTGPEAVLGGVAGLTAIGYATRGYLRSRKSLLEALRGNRLPK